MISCFFHVGIATVELLLVSFFCEMFLTKNS